MDAGTRDASPQRRRGRRAAVALAVGCVLGILSGCTSGVSAGPAGPAAATTSAPAPGVDRQSVTGTEAPPGVEPAPTGLAPTAPAEPGPSMTVIEDAAQCTVRRELAGADQRVPIDEVFPGWSSGGFSDPGEVVPGRDAGDPARCPGELPTNPYCDEELPWTGLLFDTFVTASGARRVVDGYLLAMPHGSDPEAPPEKTPGTRVVTYRLLDLAPGDPKGVGAYLDRSFRSCAQARPASTSEVPRAAGIEALVGTAPSDYRAPAAQLVLLRRGDRLVWAVLDGGGWRTGERAHALRVLVAHLL